MALKDRITFLTTPESVDEFLRAHPNCALFKAGLCHKSPETFVHVQARLDGRDDLPLGILRVVEHRAASNHVAELTGVRHESPQLFLFKDGKPVWNRDNWDITDEDIAEALANELAPAIPHA